MTENEFFETLASLKEYKWQRVGGSVIGMVRNGRDRWKWFSPIAAVARSSRIANVSGGDIYATTFSHENRAAQALGLSSSLAKATTTSVGNRGYAQVVRGRVQQATGA